MNAVVIYDSRYGNTEQLAGAIADRLAAARLVSAAEAATFDFDELDLLVIGGPTQIHGMSARLRAALNRVPPESLRGVAVAAFDTRLRMSRILSGSAARAIARRLQRKGARLVVRPESFFVTTDKGPLAQGEVERARRWAASVLAHVAANPEPTGVR